MYEYFLIPNITKSLKTYLISPNNLYSRYYFPILQIQKLGIKVAPDELVTNCQDAVSESTLTDSKI